jgi:AraC-like DNA-binding protein
MPFHQADDPKRSHVMGGGWQRDKLARCPWRDYHAYALVYLTAGSGRYGDASGRETGVAAGDLWLVFPGFQHHYEPDHPRGWTEVWLGFHGPIFSALETDGLLNRDQPLHHPGLNSKLIASFNRILAGIESGRDQAHLVAEVHSLIVTLAGEPSDDLIDQAQALLLADLRHAIDLPRIASTLGVSYDTLRRRWLRRHGLSPGRWRLLRRIEQVKDLIAAGATLEEAAETTGFCDRGFLARQFRAVVGMPPGRWRSHALGVE